MKLFFTLVALALLELASAFQPFRLVDPSIHRIIRRGTGIAGKEIDQDASRISAAKFPSFFLPEFELQAKVLSPTSIVEMLPTDDSSPTSALYATEDTTGSFVPNTKPLRQEMFNFPLVSFMYERVLPPLWEAGLRIGGPDAEYSAAAQFLDGTKRGREDGGGTAILDLSCGTGFVASRFASSGMYDRVFALDYSDKMLGELVASVERDEGAEGVGGGGLNRLSVIRGDAGSLPFRAGTFDAVHWGAAMHCVPSAEKGLEEVYRVLKPGGKLYATTFLKPFPDLVFRFFTVGELENLARSAGFEAANTRVEGRGVYGILRATK
mmetsp:Transcript_56275/g.168494  ORF Transcript_56275/g.168494 Transcript_56275/m.168494 type:complete len:323 (-) Transcript_56275:226-1194(-)|eukprot:CAMPEP_0113551152 /NCGR_PEP_ID=MMETSP0015_2-20120614/14371_1 /TAXON_ID=2838 /ORGANISM="Odontella" /LENGTH=322 /DNA_ID=CAMNT_0000452023 /DNA_START=172 /DNA_END=1140 /DNA_ORIENTATION=+ /assembly_acc=CAM_ASM_000160